MISDRVQTGYTKPSFISIKSPNVTQAPVNISYDANEKTENKNGIRHACSTVDFTALNASRLVVYKWPSSGLVVLY